MQNFRWIPPSRTSGTGSDTPACTHAHAHTHRARRLNTSRSTDGILTKAGAMRRWHVIRSLIAFLHFLPFAVSPLCCTISPRKQSKFVCAKRRMPVTQRCACVLTQPTHHRDVPSQPQRVRPYGPGRAAQDKKRNRLYADIPPLVPRGVCTRARAQRALSFGLPGTQALCSPKDAFANS